MKPAIDPAVIPHDSERLVYIALRDQLPNDYVVLHSYPWLRPDRDGHLREGEIDFVILHRSRGMLVLEVKGGELDYRQGSWLRKKRNGWQAITDPFVQARKNMHALLDDVEKRSACDVTRRHIAYGYAVVFPHHDYRGIEPPGADPAIIITQPQMANLHSIIEHAFSRWPSRQSSLDRRQWTTLLDSILPRFQLYRPLAADVDAVHLQLDELTGEQIELFRELHENPRVYIPGVAGSGKTRLALDRALAFAERGQRTLLVCFNKHLAEWLQETAAHSLMFERCSSHLDIRHFHKLARDLIREARLPFDVPDGGTLESQFWNETVPNQLEQAVMLLLDDRPVQYDAIVMDEGQDFHPRWWECLNYTLLVKPNQGPFYAFADPAQSLWEWSLGEPPIPLSTTHRLRRNCRNTRLIARSSACLAGVTTSYLHRLPLGLAPTISRVPSSAAMKGIVLERVQNLLQTQHLQAHQVALIGPARWKNSSLAATKEISGFPLTDSASQWRQGGSILVTTARAFKGLEADAVVVFDLHECGEHFRMSDLYVACTRARSHLHLCTTNRSLAEVLARAIQTAHLELSPQLSEGGVNVAGDS